MEPEIVITVNQDGEATVDVRNWVGSSCTLQSKPFVDAMGNNVITSNPKPEMFLPEQEQKNKVSY